MKRVDVEIKGISPYLMNAFGLEEAEQQEKTQIGSKDYKKEAEKKLYRMPDGTIYVPSTQIHASLIEAGKQQRVVGKGKATYSKLYASVVMITPEALVMTPQDWEVDKRPVIIPSTKGRVMRYRPKFMDWSLKFTIDILDDGVSPDTVHQGLNIAGSYVGIGDFRPTKRGPFGRFMVSSFKVVSPEE